MEHGRATASIKSLSYCICGDPGSYDEKHEAYYCSVSGVWLESACLDPECDYCAKRPDVRPMESK